MQKEGFLGAVGDAIGAAAKPVVDLGRGALDSLTGSAPTPQQLVISQAISEAKNTALRESAMGDVGKILGIGLGVGAGARGAVGLHHMLRQNMAGARSTAGSAMLPLPIPAEEEDEDVPKRKAAMDKEATPVPWLLGGDATTKGGIPWYGLSMLAGGLGGLGLGWKGVDAVMESRRKTEREQALDSARQEFHDALLSQYDKPKAVAKSAGDHTFKGEDCPKCGASMEGDPYSGACNSCGHKWGEKKALDEALDRLYDAFVEKQAALSDYLGQGSSNVLGQAMGGYGMYAGLSSLLTGAVVYDKMRKRSRSAVLQKALQRRDRRKFNQSPTEIFATPEPIAHSSADQQPVA